MSAGGPGRVRDALARLLPAERLGEFSGRDGVPGCPLAAPATPEEAAEVLRLARAERWVVLPLGNGTKLGWARPPERVELVLSSKNLAGVTSYEPADGTLSARAGTPWAELVATTAGRHHLSPELPDPATATLGGVLGAGASGLDRLRHGPVRHQVLGIQALHGDASRVKSGGRVVKNVTGYDLHRLWCGSHGTLCFVLEATLRLYAAPGEVALVHLCTASPAEGVARAHALWRGGRQPLALVLDSADFAGPAELTLVLAGRAEALASELASLRAELPAAEVLRGAAAVEARAALRAGECPGGSFAPLVLATRPSLLAPLLEALAGAARELGLSPALRIHPLLATVALSFPAGVEPERLARLALRLAELPGSRHAALHCRGLGARMPPLAQPEAARELSLRLKRSLDPDGVFVAGRP
jgi:glycolate dehydrogenase FAD-binding subunit